MKNSSTWKFIIKSLESGLPVMLLYVLESKGSSPGRQGFFMAVTADEDPSAPLRMEGSIGGGIMEHKFVEMAGEKLRFRDREPEVRKQVHDKSAAINQSGMICSGEQTIWLYPVKKEEGATIGQLIHSLEENKNGTLVLSPAGLSFEETIPKKDFEFEFESEVSWRYKEKTGYKNKLFIIGGGHCALSLSRLMQPMDFYIQVYDNRKGLNTVLANKAAHEKHIVADYTALGQLIPSGNTHYVVIMTFGYRTDDLAIKALLKKKFRYIGVLGSKKKIETLFADYRKQGIAEDLLQQIRTPIGLAINSQTPEEIAVSIAAEIIKVKNSLAADSTDDIKKYR